MIIEIVVKWAFTAEQALEWCWYGTKAGRGEWYEGACRSFVGEVVFIPVKHKWVHKFTMNMFVDFKSF